MLRKALDHGPGSSLLAVTNGRLKSSGMHRCKPTLAIIFYEVDYAAEAYVRIARDILSFKGQILKNEALG